MKKINKYLLIFCALFVISLWGGREFLQSKIFSQIVSQYINKTLPVELKGKVSISFRRLIVDVLPLSTTLEGVNFSFNDDENTVLLKDTKLNFRMNYWDLFLNRLVFKDVQVENGLAEIELKQKGGKKTRRLKMNELYEQIKYQVDFSSPVKFRRVSIRNQLISFNNQNLEIREAVFDNLKDRFLVKTSVGGAIRNVEGMNTDVEIDDLSVDVDWSGEKLDLKDLSIKSTLDHIALKGIVEEKKNKLVSDLKFKASVATRKYIEKYLHLENIQGVLFLDGRVTGTIDDYSWQSNLTVKDLETPYLKVASLFGELAGNQNEIRIQGLSVQNKKGMARIIEPVSLVNLKEKRLSVQTVRAKLDRLDANDIFYFLEGDLDILKGDLSGEVIVNLENLDDITIEIAKDLSWKNFKLAEEVNDPILVNNEITVEKGQVRIRDDVYLDLSIKKNLMKFRAIGSISEKIDIEVKNGRIDLQEFGPISGENLYGHGFFDLSVSGPIDDVILKFDVNLDEFEVIDLYLGAVRSKFNLGLEDVSLELKRFLGQVDQTFYAGSGTINFDRETIDLGVEIGRGRFVDLKRILKKIDKDGLFEKLKEGTFEFKSNFKIGGGLASDKIKVTGWSDFKKIRLFENFKRFFAKFSFAEEKVEIRDLVLKKGGGTLTGKAHYDFEKEFVDYSFDLEGLSLRDIDLYRKANSGFDSLVDGSLVGNGEKNNFKSRSKLTLYKSQINGEPLNPSIINISSTGKSAKVKASVFEDVIKLNSSIDLSGKKKNSFLDIKYDVKDLPFYLSALPGNKVERNDVEGSVSGSIVSKFKFGDLKDADAKIIFTKAEIIEGSKDLRLVKPTNVFVVRDGKISSDKVVLKGRLGRIQLSGSGSLDKDFVLKNEFQVDPALFKIFNEKIEHLDGSVSGKAEFVGGKQKSYHLFEIVGKNLTAKIKKVPAVLEKGDFRVTGDNETIILHHAKAKFGDGDINGKGSIVLKIPFPVVDVKFNLNNNKVQPTDRSSVIISGDVELVGERIPYELKSNISVLYGLIQDEFQDLIPKDTSTSYDRYIPQTKSEASGGVLKNNLDINFSRPLAIKNKLVELYFVGGLKVTGQASQPKVAGEISIPPGTSKLSFKGNEFILTRGNINLDSKNIDTKVLLDFEGNSEVDKYQVFLSVKGEAKKPQIELTSEPYLSQEDILSLLTIGVTGDVSKDLRDEERSSLTALGVGTLIMEQLNFDKGLNSSLGLKLTVSPEFREDETSLIQGKSAVTNNAANKVKSATKIKLGKKLTKKIDLSVSSTVGGSLEQTQEMNINFNLTKKLSIEGGVEVRSTDQSSSVAPTSIGVDVKYKGSFK